MPGTWWLEFTSAGPFRVQRRLMEEMSIWWNFPNLIEFKSLVFSCHLTWHYLFGNDSNASNWQTYFRSFLLNSTSFNNFALNILCVALEYVELKWKFHSIKWQSRTRTSARREQSNKTKNEISNRVAELTENCLPHSNIKRDVKFSLCNLCYCAHCHGAAYYDPDMIKSEH